MLPGKITAADVAAAAGVSPSTVSRALRNHPGLPLATCARIQALADKMGYRPDPLISALLARRFKKKGQEIGTIAYITAFPTRDGWRYGFSMEVYKGAKARALKCGYLLELFWLREPKMTGRRLSDILMSRGIRGICLAPLPHGYGHLRLRWEQFSCAAIGYSMIRPSLHRATAHHFHNMLLALRSLRQAGFRRIGVVIPVHHNQKVGENYLAATLFYQKRYGSRSISILEIAFDERAQSLEAVREEIKEWVASYRPDCIHGPNIFATILAPVLPREIVVASQNGMGLASRHLHIDEKPELVGAMSINLIIEQIQHNETGIPKDPKVVMVEGRWAGAC